MLTPGIPFNTPDSSFSHQTHADALFDALDTDKDGVISRAEFAATLRTSPSSECATFPWGSPLGLLSPGVARVHENDAAAR